MQTLMGHSVLVVEDDTETLELYAMALTKRGFRLQRARNAESAIAMMRASRPDVVLCDLHLPGHDGYTVLDAIHTDPALHDIPVIAISGSHPAIERERSLRAGFVQYFSKPAKLRDIVDALLVAIYAPIVRQRFAV